MIKMEHKADKELIDALKKLREPFAEKHISKLPKPTCSRDEYRSLPKAKCDICGGYHATSRTIHLDYVGHAALTDRLLDVDPLWTWEPLGVDESGLPKFDKSGGMWIKLTICGITRLGYGHAGEKNGGDAIKEIIGDALRNAAMRFGAALDLWHKGDLSHDDNDTPKPQHKTDIEKYNQLPQEVKDLFDTLGVDQKTRIGGCIKYNWNVDTLKVKLQEQVDLKIFTESVGGANG